MRTSRWRSASPTLFATHRAELPGTVLFLFQPAEEGDPDGGATGALRMLDDRLFADPTPAAIFGLHVLPTMQVGQLGVNVGAAMASSNRFTITITGKKTHGAYPHTGIDPIPVAAQVVMALQTIPSRMNNAAEPDRWCRLATINGGNRFNIIADSVTMTGTVRTLTKDGPDLRQGADGARSSRASPRPQAPPTPSTARERQRRSPTTIRRSRREPARARRRRRRTRHHHAAAADGRRGLRATTSRRCRASSSSSASAITAKQITAMIHTEYFDIDEDALPIGVRALASVTPRLPVSGNRMST